MGPAENLVGNCCSVHICTEDPALAEDIEQSGERVIRLDEFSNHFTLEVQVRGIKLCTSGTEI